MGDLIAGAPAVDIRLQHRGGRAIGFRRGLHPEVGRRGRGFGSQDHVSLLASVASQRVTARRVRCGARPGCRDAARPHDEAAVTRSVGRVAQRPPLLPPALPLGMARSGRLALPPAAEFVVAVSAPVAPRETAKSTSLPVVLGCCCTTGPPRGRRRESARTEPRPTESRPPAGMRTRTRVSWASCGSPYCRIYGENRSAGSTFRSLRAGDLLVPFRTVVGFECPDRNSRRRLGVRL